MDFLGLFFFMDLFFWSIIFQKTVFGVKVMPFLEIEVGLPSCVQKKKKKKKREETIMDILYRLFPVLFFLHRYAQCEDLLDACLICSFPLLTTSLVVTVCIPMRCSLGFRQPVENQCLRPPMHGEACARFSIFFFALCFLLLLCCTNSLRFFPVDILLSDVCYVHLTSVFFLVDRARQCHSYYQIFLKMSS